MTNNEPYYDLTVLWRFKNNNQKDKTLIFNINMLFSKQCDYDQLVLIVSAVSHEQHHFVPERVMYDSVCMLYSKSRNVTFNPQRGAVTVKTAVSSGRRTQSSPVNLKTDWALLREHKNERVERLVFRSGPIRVSDPPQPSSVRSHPEQTTTCIFHFSVGLEMKNQN